MTFGRAATVAVSSLILGLMTGIADQPTVYAGETETCGNTNCAPLGSNCWYEFNWHCTQSKKGCIGAHECDNIETEVN